MQCERSLRSQIRVKVTGWDCVLAINGTCRISYQLSSSVYTKVHVVREHLEVFGVAEMSATINEGK